MASFAWYVIYSNKNMFGKPHLISNHGKLGAFVMILYFGVGIVGGVLLNPSWGLYRTDKTIRAMHKWIARGATFLAWTTCVLGFATIDINSFDQFLFIFPLFLFGYYILL